MTALINVCGLGRSGSTMLDLMLGNDDRAFSCGEVYAWFRPWRRHHWTLKCSCGQDPCPVWQKIKDGPASTFHARTFDALDVDYIVDSSKTLSWLVDANHWAQSQDHDVYNVLIWKDPRELAHSHWKRGRDPMTWRKPFLTYHKALIDVGLPFVSVPFRALVEDPAARLAEVCRAVDMPYWPGKEAFWTRESHHIFGSSGTRKQVETGTSAIRADEGFSDDFQPVLAEVERRIAEDAALSDIIARIEDRAAAQAAGRVPSHFRRPALPPAWYRTLQAKSLFYRWFPKPAL